MFSRSFSVFGALLLGLTVAAPAAAQAQAKIAVVDTERAVMETEDGLRAQATLKKLFDSKQHELDKKQEELVKEREDIEKQRDVLSKGALAKRADKWQRDMMQLQQKFVEYNQDIQKKQSELTQPVFQKTMNIIRRLATQEGIDMVVDKKAVPYVRSDLDYTDRVITMYNSGGAGAGDDKAAPGAKDAPKAPAAKAPAPMAPPVIAPPKTP
ncbi:MAG: OmpH family outer membrane protein [Myxococcales bacterium]|nr:MAG: OmpH family outer membrane protein [Myxococcales bacterium]